MFIISVLDAHFFCKICIYIFLFTSVLFTISVILKSNFLFLFYLLFFLTFFSFSFHVFVLNFDMKDPKRSKMNLSKRLKNLKSRENLICLKNDCLFVFFCCFTDLISIHLLIQAFSLMNLHFFLSSFCRSESLETNLTWMKWNEDVS